MAIKVIRGRVRTGGSVFFPGQIILGLSKADEQELADLGVGQYVGSEQSAEDNQTPFADDIGLVNLGGGYYQLPNGEKVRGKDKALEALAELEQSDNGEGGPDTGIPGADA